MARLAVIGGSGLYQLEGGRVREEREVPTPWGLPSDALTIMEIAGEEVAFLPRHGKGHRYLPSEVPSRANIWALRSIGVEQILAFSAVGSLSESFAPGEFVLCDNLIDKTVETRGQLLRRRGRGAHRVRPAVLRRDPRGGRGSARSPLPSPSYLGYVRVHGGSCVLHQGGIGAAPIVEGIPDRDDGPARRPGWPGRLKSATRPSQW